MENVPGQEDQDALRLAWLRAELQIAVDQLRGGRVFTEDEVFAEFALDDQE